MLINILRQDIRRQVRKKISTFLPGEAKKNSLWIAQVFEKSSPSFTFYVADK